MSKTRIELDAPVEQLYQLAIREGNAKKPVFEMHKWWARRLGSVFRMLILLATADQEQSDTELWRRFYEGDDLSNLRLLDPFMGGGTSIVEATKLKIQTAGCDIDPVAWFVTRQEVGAVNLEALRAELEKLEASEVATAIKTLYQTHVPAPLKADENIKIQKVVADVVYNFWVDVLNCPYCHHEFEAHNHYKLLFSKDKPTQTVFCQECHRPAVLSADSTLLNCQYCLKVTNLNDGPIDRGKYKCPNCGNKGRVVDLAQGEQPLPKRWFAIEFIDPITKARQFKVPDADDLQIYEQTVNRLAQSETSLHLPQRPIPMDGRSDQRPTTHGYHFYKQLFNPRQLLALGWLLDWISRIENGQVRDYFTLAFSDSLAANNMLCSFAYGYDKLTPLFGLHAYNMITRPVENNVWGAHYGRGSFLRCLNKVILGKEYCSNPYESRYPGEKLEKVFVNAPIMATLAKNSEEWYAQPSAEELPRSLLLNQQSQNLSQIRDSSIDLILTDPPYYNNLAYSELADFYYAWIQPQLEQTGASWVGPTTPHNQSLFVRHGQQAEVNFKEFDTGLTSIFRQCHRVLCDDGLLVFTYHHLDAVAWIPLARALLRCGFKVTNVFPVRSEGSGTFHSSQGNIKWDAVFTCRKRHEARSVTKLTEELEEMMLNTAKTELAKWQHRLHNAGIEFSWADCLSFAYAIGLRVLTQINLSEEAKEIDKLFFNFSQQIIATLPPEIQTHLKKRNTRAIADFI